MQFPTAKQLDQIHAGFRFSKTVGHFIGASLPSCEICHYALTLEECESKRYICSSCSKDYADAAVIIRSCALQCAGEWKHKLWRVARICDDPIVVSEYLTVAGAHAEIQNILMRREIGNHNPASMASMIVAKFLSVLPIHPMRYPKKLWGFAHPVVPARY